MDRGRSEIHEPFVDDQDRLVAEEGIEMVQERMAPLALPDGGNG
jgi:hypothetical protein